jgi:hypothetical protein
MRVPIPGAQDRISSAAGWEATASTPPGVELHGCGPELIADLRNVARSIISAATVRGPLGRRYALGALAAYVLLGSIIAVHHEPWRDEADAWLVAGHADVVEFVKHASLVGAPELWYVLLIPLARAGAPYEAQTILHFCVAIATAALVLFRSPFPPLTKWAAVFSYYLAYEYAIVARTYALSVLLLFAIAALYRSRFERPLRYALAVALVANTNSHSLFIAAFLGVFYAYEASLSRRLRSCFPAMAIMVLGGFLAAVQIESDAGDRGMGFVHIQPGAAIGALGQAFLPMMDWPIAPMFGAVLVAVVLWWLRRNPSLLAFLLASYAAIAMILTFWWMGGLRHAGFFFILVMMAIWIELDRQDEGQRRSGTGGTRAVLALLTLSLIFSDYSTALVDLLDYRDAFSGAKEMAGFINSHGLDRQPLAAHSETAASALAPYFGHPLWYAGIEDYGTFVRWDRKSDAGLNVTYPEAVHRAKRHFRGRRDFLIVLNVEIPDPASEGLALVYATSVPVFEHVDERFWLYRPAREGAAIGAVSSPP